METDNIITFDSTKRAIKICQHKDVDLNFYISESSGTNFRAFCKEIPGILAGLCPAIVPSLGGLNIIFDDESNIDAYQYENTIVISLGLLEHLWLSCYLHYGLYTQTAWGNPSISDINHQPDYSEDLIACLNRLFKDKDTLSSIWPEELPKPSPSYNLADKKNEDFASEFAIHSYICVLLHEIKHFLDYKNGETYSRPILAEYAADNFAIEEFVKNIDKAGLDGQKLKNAYGKRMLALIEMGEFLSFYETLSIMEDGIHPNGFYRIHNILRQNTYMFDLVDDENYDPQKDLFDIKPAIQYACFVLSHDLQLLLPDGSDVKQSMSTLLSQKHESPFYVYKNIIFFLMTRIIDIHQTSYLHKLKEQWQRLIKESRAGEMHF